MDAPLQCEVLAAGRKLGASRRQQQQQIRGQQPAKELSAAQEKPRPTGGDTAGESVCNSSNSSGHHRPADLAVSDSGLYRLYQRVAALLPQDW